MDGFRILGKPRTKLRLYSGPKRAMLPAIETSARPPRSPIAGGLRPWTVFFLGALILLCSSRSSWAQGFSARFSTQTLTYLEDAIVEVEFTGPTNLIGEVRVELRTVTSTIWHQQKALYLGERRYQALFPQKKIWPTDARPRAVLLRAFILGKRGGQLLSLGEFEPLEVDVLTPSQAAQRKADLSQGVVEEDDEAFSLTGYVGAEGRLTTNARARIFIAGGAPVSDQSAVIVSVAVGPTFDKRPELGDGILAVGFELGWRWFTRPPTREFTLFTTPYAQIDLRLPGLDAGAGLRVGALWRMSSQVAAELSIGGGPVILRLSDEIGDPSLAFSASTRIALQLGGD